MSGTKWNVSSPTIDHGSQTWRLVAFVTAMVILVPGLVWLLAFQAPREPVYRGKALSVWLQTYSWSSSSGRHSREWNEADDAVRHIGTNCIPVLLHMIREKDSKFKISLIALAQKQRLIKTHFIPASVRNVEASRAFIVLGDMAKDAVPQLVQMYERNISFDSQCAIEDAFAWIGPAAKPAIPLLLGAATNSKSRLRANAFWALGEIHTQPDLCVPALIGALNDSDEWAVLSAAHALGMFGTNAQSAVPWLIKLTNAPTGFRGVQAMLEARQALKKIGLGGDTPPTEIFSDFGISSTNWLVPSQ